MQWPIIVLAVCVVAVLLGCLVAVCGGCRIAPLACCASKWFVWAGALLQLGVVGLMLVALVNNSWTTAIVPPGHYLNFGLTTAFYTNSNTVREHAPPAGAIKYGDWCQLLIPLGFREQCITVTFGALAVLLFGLLYLLAGLAVIVFTLAAICGRRLYAPTRSSAVQFILGLGIVVAWLCADHALNVTILALDKVGAGITFHSWTLGRSWLFALASTAVALPLMVLFAQPEQPETVLYALFTNVRVDSLKASD